MVYSKTIIKPEVSFLLKKKKKLKEGIASEKAVNKCSLHLISSGPGTAI